MTFPPASVGPSPADFWPHPLAIFGALLMLPTVAAVVIVFVVPGRPGPAPPPPQMFTRFILDAPCMPIDFQPRHPVVRVPPPEWIERPPAKITSVDPIRPPSVSSRVQGYVILEIHVDCMGNVLHARVLRSLPGLDQAALDAVMQWRYQPPRVDGRRSGVIMTVTVNFPAY
jgi:TonB family protein